MTDAMREMIAQLMGTQKEGEEGRDLPPYDHPSVCRAYLVGCCPYELVPDSRLQGLLSCRRMHEPAHKADYQKAQQNKDHFYDVDAFEVLENAVQIVDGEINRIKAKLDRESREQNDSAEIVKVQRIADLDEKISKTVEEMEELGNQGKVDESIKLSKQVEELRQRKSELEFQNTQEVRVAGPGSNASRLRVCDDCGAQLNILDHETRIADHFNGKMHLGMVEVREKYTTMKETIEDRKRERKEKLGDEPRFYERRRSPPRRERRDERDNRDRERDRDRERGDRDRHSNRRRSRSRSRDRERRRDDDRRRDDRDRHRFDRDRRDRRH